MPAVLHAAHMHDADRLPRLRVASSMRTSARPRHSGTGGTRGAEPAVGPTHPALSQPCRSHMHPGAHALCLWLVAASRRAVRRPGVQG